MRRHEVAAERLIGWLRAAIGLCTFVTVIAAGHVLRQLTGVHLDLFERDAWIAALAFLVLGAVSVALAVPQRWRHSYAYLFMVLDVALVSLPGQWPASAGWSRLRLRAAGGRRDTGIRLDEHRATNLEPSSESQHLRTS